MKKKDIQILGSCQKAEEAAEQEVDGETNCNLLTWNGLQGFGNETEKVVN